MARRIIDLTHPIHQGMPTFPVAWHPTVEVTQLGRHGIEGRETRKLVLGTHTGTHMDAPRHFLPNAPTIDQIPVDLLVGPAEVVDVRPNQPRHCFDVCDFEDRLGERRPTRLILRFGWSVHWGSLRFYSDQPFLTEAAAQWLIDRGVRLLAMDTPQIDSPEHGRACSKDSPNHKIMLGQGAVFVECCANLERITRREVELAVLPLLIQGGDGAPCRVVAIEEGPLD